MLSHLHSFLTTSLEALERLLTFSLHPSPEKSLPHLMSAPQCVVPGVFFAGKFGGPPSDWVAMLIGVNEVPGSKFHANRFRTLKNCYITRVMHCRFNQHELIMLEVVNGNHQAREPETRYIVVERLKIDRSSRSSSVVFSEELSGKNTGNMDTITIYENLENRDRLRNYLGSTVETLYLKQGCFNVLQAATLAAALTEFAGDYSLLRYMCFWYACAFREMVKKIVGEGLLRAVQGPAYSEAGCIGNLRCVSATADFPVFTSLESTAHAETQITSALKRGQNNGPNNERRTLTTQELMTSWMERLALSYNTTLKNNETTITHLEAILAEHQNRVAEAEARAADAEAARDEAVARATEAEAEVAYLRGLFQNGAAVDMARHENGQPQGWTPPVTV
ncbi:hypothetical protein B0H16DRAFT_1493637 [Mycena metata]|uniref:Uncharacterized protein n=1 Tax=Mycena metata TaxID=1033252 RepID=A0AAD7MMM5_9AGAR|nr:hypothetical protein B0H16DRAFT_1596689 [Mycena metata]KAJ7784751.1 hypothetical protein B0H16DRAFT_1493637 [Mycena metata]